MQTYLALLRGVNVGGNGLIKMSALVDSLSLAGLAAVRAYIQSGNIIFQSDVTDRVELASRIKSILVKEFALGPEVVVFSAEAWRAVVAAAPAWWGTDKTWKHNLLVLTEPIDIDNVVEAIGELKPNIERIKSGNGVVYQSLSLKMFGRTTSGKLASNPIYKKMTVRNYNTTLKLLSLLD